MKHSLMQENSVNDRSFFRGAWRTFKFHICVVLNYTVINMKVKFSLTATNNKDWAHSSGHERIICTSTARFMIMPQRNPSISSSQITNQWRQKYCNRNTWKMNKISCYTSHSYCHLLICAATILIRILLAALELVTVGHEV